MNGSEHLEVSVERPDDSTVVLQPVGEVDLSCAASLRQELRQVQAENPSKLIVDLQRVPHMDSSGVATLVEAMQTARRAKTALVLCGMQERVRAVFEISKLDTVFTIVENADKAVTA